MQVSLGRFVCDLQLNLVLTTPAFGQYAPGIKGNHFYLRVGQSILDESSRIGTRVANKC